MTDYANELRRHAYKVGRPAGDIPAVMHQAANYIGDLERKLREAEARVAELEAERAELEKQEPVAWMNEKNSFICKDPKNADFCVPLYAAPPVTAQSEGQIDKPTSLLRRAADYLGDAGAPRLASEISSYLESQAQPARGEG